MEKPNLSERTRTRNLSERASSTGLQAELQAQLSDAEETIIALIMNPSIQQALSNDVGFKDGAAMLDALANALDAQNALANALDALANAQKVATVVKFAAVGAAMAAILTPVFDDEKSVTGGSLAARRPRKGRRR